MTHTIQGACERVNILGKRSHPPGTFGRSSLEQLKTWLGACLVDHKTCHDSWARVATKRRLPTGLLEAIGSLDQLIIHVVHTSRLAIKTEYLTLSHCVSETDLIGGKMSTLALFHQ